MGEREIERKVGAVGRGSKDGFDQIYDLIKRKNCINVHISNPDYEN